MAKRPRDLNQLAKLVVDIASGDTEDAVSAAKRKPALWGSAGGLKGGTARANVLTPEKRAAIARKAAAARWER